MVRFWPTAARSRRTASGSYESGADIRRVGPERLFYTDTCRLRSSGFGRTQPRAYCQDFLQQWPVCSKSGLSENLTATSAPPRDQFATPRMSTGSYTLKADPPGRMGHRQFTNRLLLAILGLGSYRAAPHCFCTSRRTQNHSEQTSSPWVGHSLGYPNLGLSAQLGPLFWRPTSYVHLQRMCYSES